MVSLELSAIRVLAGSRGGKSTVSKHGPEHMAEIGRKGGRRYLPPVEYRKQEEGLRVKGSEKFKHFRELQIRQENRESQES